MKDTNCNQCEMRQAHHPEEVKKKLENRLNRIEGQVRGIKKMIKEDVYCDGILNQIASVRSALGGVEMILLENHIKTCVKEQLEEGKNEVIEELSSTIRRMLK